MRREAGFTLVELVIALAVGAVVVLVAHQLFATVADRGRTLMVSRSTLDRAANARRWLKATFLSLDVGTESASGFDGRPDHAAFSAWLVTPSGWFERRQITLGRSGARFVATVTPGATISLIDNVADVQFDYLLDPGAESRWVREWVSPVSAPIAVRLRMTRAGPGFLSRNLVVDTLLCLIKDRG